jgi:hypothetical protein
LKVALWAASQHMVQMVRLIDPSRDINDESASAWPRSAVDLKFCVDEHLRSVRTAQKLYGILGMNEFGYSKTSGCQIMGCGDDQFCALGLPSQLRQSPASAQPDDGDDDSIHETMLPTLNTYGSVQSIRAISAGGMHSVALTTNGVPYTWGAPDEQQLGRSVLEPDPNDPKTQINTDTRPRPVVGFVSLDGQNDDGQIHQVAAGEAHTHFVALSSGQVYSAGTFRDMATNTIRVVPSECILAGHHVVPIPMPGPVFSVHSKNNMSAAILKDGRVVTWGKCVHECAAFSFLGLFSMTSLNFLPLRLDRIRKCGRASPQRWHDRSG